MALQECRLNLNQKLKELRPHGTLEFPCAGYSSYYTGRQEDSIPWHWHEEIEMVYVAEGRLELKIPSESFYVETGDAFVINSNVLHYAIAADYCKLHSLVFHPTLILGNEDSVFAKKYVRPLVSCHAFSGCAVSWFENAHVIQWFCSAFDAIVQEPPGFEFVVRENLSRVCFFLTEKFKDELEVPETLQSQDNLRIRKMLEYIQRYYFDDIKLADIAKAADIGERECLRCFQKTIQLSPIQYVLKYRIIRGAEMLLHNPENSISEIATACGFESPSNFSKIFKRFYKCTPREYRKKEND